MSNDAPLQNEYSQKNPRYYIATRPEMQPFIPPTARRILEVGCGEGDFAAALKRERGVEVWGVEAYPPAAEVAAQKLDKVLCAGFDSTLNLPAESFDAIAFNDVLEHLVDPFAAVRYCHTLLAPKGVIVASIPNIRYFPVLYQLAMQSKFEYQEAGVLDRTHLRFFTHTSMKSLFERNGFVVTHQEGINRDRSRKLRLLNLLTFNRFWDSAFVQFAVVAQKR